MAALHQQHPDLETWTWGHSQREPQTLVSVPLVPSHHSSPGSAFPVCACSRGSHLKHRGCLCCYYQPSTATLAIRHWEQKMSLCQSWQGVEWWDACVKEEPEIWCYPFSTKPVLGLVWSQTLNWNEFFVLSIARELALSQVEPFISWSGSRNHSH